MQLGHDVTNFTLNSAPNSEKSLDDREAQSPTPLIQTTISIENEMKKFEFPNSSTIEQEFPVTTVDGADDDSESLTTNQPVNADLVESSEVAAEADGDSSSNNSADSGFNSSKPSDRSVKNAYYKAGLNAAASTLVSNGNIGAAKQFDVGKATPAAIDAESEANITDLLCGAQRASKPSQVEDKRSATDNTTTTKHHYTIIPQISITVHDD